MNNLQKIAVPAGVLVGVIVVVTWAAKDPIEAVATPDWTYGDDFEKSVDAIDSYFGEKWREEDITPAVRADEFLVLRRLSLALHGTVPSLEELRDFEGDPRADRLRQWTLRMLDDQRFNDYFAERLARAFVGVGEGQFLIFRRDRFVAWLSEQLKAKTPYNELVHQMIASTGLWTGQPSTNFVTVGFANEEFDANKLAGRSVRAFLGQRIDCAQCHDHPFDHWTQEDFEGLAAHFGQVGLSPVGLRDVTMEKKDGEDKPKEYIIEDRETLEERVVSPRVPFGEEYAADEGTRRQRLAQWITHKNNRRFERAISNRLWGLMLGRPYYDPVDDLADPPEGETDLLDILGKDFREHGYDLHRMILMIAESYAFRVDSVHPEEDELALERIKDNFAVFPMTRLRPEQWVGSMQQAGGIKTIDADSHLFQRFLRVVRTQDFIREYGDLGENELEERAGTIPQALLRMNGQLSTELSKAEFLTSTGRIANMASNDEKCLETIYLVCLTRRPVQVEREYFSAQFNEVKGKDNRRTQVIEDIFWTLFNSPEFSWNH